MEILLKSAEAPAFFFFFSLVRCVGAFLGLIEGLATFAEEGGLHGGWGTRFWMGKTRSSRSMSMKTILLVVFLFLAWSFIFYVGLFFFFVSAGFSILFSSPFLLRGCWGRGFCFMVIISSCSLSGEKNDDDEWIFRLS